MIIPIQPFGLGDGIFVQSLVKQISDGDKILYPVYPQFVDGLNRAYPDVTFVDWQTLKVPYDAKNEVITDTYRTLPIRFADQLLKVPYHNCMRAKYDLYGLDWNTWRDVKPDIDTVRGYYLFEQIAGLSEAFLYSGGKFNLVSPCYGSNSQFRADIKIDNGLPNIVMSSLDGYSLFDWGWMIQNATTIHAVSSSIVYLLELLDLNAEEVHLYGRDKIEPKTWYKNIEYLLTKQYTIHAPQPI